jgi:formylglycine-generating enzyme required for sulfatase activity
MALVPAGTFMMGSNEGESNEKLVHRVTISKPFYMSVYEITQKEWRDVMGTTVRQQQDMADTSWPLRGEGDSYPMYYVSWQEAIEYCNWRSVKEGLTPAYSGSGNAIQCNFNASGYRLPTEAEWEWAARGGGKDPLEYTYSGSNSAASVAWYYDNSGNSTHSVGTKRANSLGLYDMSGNVYEWCWDWYGSYGNSAVTDPMGAASGSRRVERGGGCFSIMQFVRSVDRYSDTPTNRYNDLGFRVVSAQRTDLAVKIGGETEAADYPDWFLNPPPYEGFIVGIGVSTSRDQSIALAQAQTRARVAIAQTLDANIQAMVVAYQRAHPETNLSFFEDISRPIRAVNVSGAVIKHTYFAKKGANKGTVYCMAVLNAADAKKWVVDAASAMGILAEFNAMNASARLDEQFAKHDVRPAVW